MEQNRLTSNQISETSLGENYIANCTGISITLKNGLAKSIIQEVMLTLVDFILILSGKDKTSLDSLTYKPLLFSGNQTYFGLTNEELTIFISGPNLITVLETKEKSKSYDFDPLVGVLNDNTPCKNKLTDKKSRNSELYTIGIYDSLVCKKFFESFHDEALLEVQNIRRLIDEGVITMDKMYYRLTVPTNIVDSSEMDSLLRKQTIKQNQFNVSLISLDKEYNRKRGFESRPTMFRKRTRNRNSTLIIGSPTQNEMCYVTPTLSVFGQGLVIQFNYIISKPMALAVFEDIAQSSILNKINHILTGYFYVFLSRFQLETTFFNVFETLNQLGIKAYTPGVRNPKPLVGDRSLIWFNRAARGLQNIMEKNKNKNYYREQMLSLFYNLGVMIPDLITSQEFKDLALYLNSEIQKVSKGVNEPILLEITEDTTLFSPQDQLFQSTPENFFDFLKEAFRVNTTPEKTKLKNNLTRFKAMFSDPIKSLPENLFYNNEIVFWQAISYWNLTRDKGFKVQTVFDEAIKVASDLTERVLESPQRWSLRTQKTEEFSRAAKFLEFIGEYLTIRDKAARIKKIEDILVQMFQLLDPSFSANSIKNFMSEVNQSFKSEWPADILDQLKEKNLNILVEIVRNPLKLLKTNSLEIYNADYDSLTSGQKRAQTTIIRRLKVDQIVALDNIFMFGQQIADEASVQTDLAAKARLEESSQEFFNAYEELWEDLKENIISLKEEKGQPKEGGPN